MHLAQLRLRLMLYLRRAHALLLLLLLLLRPYAHLLHALPRRLPLDLCLRHHHHTY
jgi:hypothetical protein